MSNSHRLEIVPNLLLWLKRLEVRHQAGKFLGRDLIRKPFRHHGSGACATPVMFLMGITVGPARFEFPIRLQIPAR